MICMGARLRRGVIEAATKATVAAFGVLGGLPRARRRDRASTQETSTRGWRTGASASGEATIGILRNVDVKVNADILIRWRLMACMNGKTHKNSAYIQLIVAIEAGCQESKANVTSHSTTLQPKSAQLGSALAIRLGSTRSARLDRLNNLPTTYHNKNSGRGGWGIFLEMLVGLSSKGLSELLCVARDPRIRPDSSGVRPA